MEHVITLQFCFHTLFELRIHHKGCIFLSKSNKLNLSASQNFLTSRKTIDRLLRISDITKDDDVLEIGAGKGHITKVLIKRCKSITAVELDRKLYSKLLELFSGDTNVKLINNDFLNIQLPKHEYKVFSNIPFSITTDIVRKLTQADNPPTNSWLIMEKGAAKRFVGVPNDNLQSLLLKPFYDLEIRYHFCKEDFHPSPSVDTVFLHISKKSTPDINFSQRNIYYDFINRSYKYGLNSLLTKRQISIALRSLSLPPIPSSGEILYIQWLCLFRSYVELYK